MQNTINARLIVVLAVLALAILFVIPSINYFYSLSVTPIPQRDQYETEEAFTSATAQYNQRMTRLREGIPILGRPLPLGLDLQGGVDVLMAISRDDIRADELTRAMRSLRTAFGNDNIDAQIAMNASRDGIVVLLNDPEYSANNAQAILETYTDVFEPWSEANLSDPDEGVTLRFRDERLSAYEREAIDSAMLTVRNRVDELGVTMPIVQRVGDRFIRVQVPGERDPQRVIDLVIQPARLEFRLVHPEQDRLLQDIELDEHGRVAAGQLPANYTVMFSQPLSDAEATQRPHVHEVLIESDIRGQAERMQKVQAYVVRREADLTGADLSDARYFFDPNELSQSPHKVSVTFGREGTRTFRSLTEEHVGDQLAILLEGRVVSAPVLQAVITDGRAVISGGDFTAQTAGELSLVLRAGALPTTLRTEQQQSVGATLGLDAIRGGLTALMVGALLVTIFMMSYYFTAGVIAVLALIINVLCVIAVLALSRATLTLSGIGGILLTVGMAVDANVLIFERLREEVKQGGTIKAILSRGFGKAFSTIFDANVTTLITAMVLLQFGAATMQGFALTMSFGIFATLFTGLFVTRVLTDTYALPRGGISLGAYRLLADKHINFLALRKYSYVFSTILLLLGIGGIIQNKGLNLGVDFRGGATTTVRFAGDEVDESEIRSLLPTVQVQRILDQHNAFIITSELLDDDVDATTSHLTDALDAGFAERYTIEGVTAVGRSVSRDFAWQALMCVIISAICIFIYIWFRFERAFGGAAVAALFHDIILTFGMLELLDIQISLEVVAALLMVFGYSINDTIVVFDRIRENLQTIATKNFERLINVSVNQCLSRTLITSFTTLVAVLSMYIIGAEGLRDFALTLFIGFIIGTYSSSFVATPILYDWRRRHLRELQTAEGPSGGEGRGGSARMDEDDDKPTGPIKPQRKASSGPRTKGVRVKPIDR